ncbi:MAG TPA: hypothetical protein VHT24_15050 [Pseudacidobacterium sp.]|jgi:tetratricopeptide (TPR) repeat protein|nr:hypothetical protein [Pseudacidobacterium sp.]
MMIKKPIRPFALAFMICAGPTGIAAQQTVSIPQQPPVYVVDFQQKLPPELASKLGNLNTFTSDLIKIRLQEIPSVTVRRVQAPPSCEEAQAQVNQGSRPQAGQTAQVLPTAVVSSGDFYTVEGQIEAQGQRSEILLSYEVEKHTCGQKDVQPVFQDALPFTPNQALDAITIAAHAIAFKIQKAVPPTQIDVTVFQIDSDLQQQKDIAAGVRKALVDEIAKWPDDYKVATPSNYRITGHITFQKSRLPIPWNATVTADMKIEADGKPYPLQLVTGSSDQLLKFYEAVTNEVIRGLPEVLAAVHLQLTGFDEAMKVDQINHLLDQCPPEGECAGAQDAVTLLSVDALKNPNSWNVFFLLGKAQLRAGKAGDAVTSLEKAESLVEQNQVAPAEQAQLLNLLGDGYRNTYKWEQALSVYDNSLKLDPKQAAVYGSKAQVYLYLSKSLDALRSLIEGLKVSTKDSDSQPLHESAKSIVNKLQGTDINAAETSLREALSAGVPVSNEYGILTEQKWELILRTNWNAENRAKARGEFKAALDHHPNDPDVLALLYTVSARVELVDGDRQHLQDLVAEVGKFDAAQVPAYIREWAKRILSQDDINHADYEDAAKAADEAYHIQPTNDDASYMIANATLLDARCKEAAWSRGEKFEIMERETREKMCMEDKLLDPAVTEVAKLPPEIVAQYKEAADIASQLVDNKYQAAYGVFMRANHSLNKDTETKIRFERLAAKDPKDQVTSNILMFVCSEYVFDFHCAYQAAKNAALSVPTTGSTAADDWLNLAETAILDGDDKTARNWLDIALRQPDPTPRNASLIYLYRLWVAMREGQTSEFKQDFDSWSEAANKFSQGKDGISWIFTGARKVLADPRSSLGQSRIKLLVAMMDALDNKSSSLPPWPDSGTL